MNLRTLVKKTPEIESFEETFGGIPGQTPSSNFEEIPKKNF